VWEPSSEEESEDEEGRGDEDADPGATGEVDVDSDDEVQPLMQFNPKTGETEVQKGNGSSHWLLDLTRIYRCSTP